MRIKSVVIALVCMVLISVSFFTRNKSLDSDYIMKSSSVHIKIKDVDRFNTPTVYPTFQDENSSYSENQALPEINKEKNTEDALIISGYFKTINGETLKYLRFLHRNFRKSKNLKEHLQHVLRYLESQLSPADAKRAYDIYASYLDCEMALETKLAQWNQPTDAEDMLESLARVQEIRREFLGDDLADALYGTEVKSKEYSVRRSVIVADEDLYGIEKEELIEQLNADMWGEEAGLVETGGKQPYQRYREKINLYSKDFSEISKDEKEEMIFAFRNTFFPEEIVERLENVDAQISAENQQEAAYFQKESEIMMDARLSEEQKSAAIDELQDEIFEQNAESFRRRENIRKGLEQLIEDGSS